jgi:4-hydroxy-tetrahydrodipicolinate synthase
MSLNDDTSQSQLECFPSGAYSVLPTPFVDVDGSLEIDIVSFDVHLVNQLKTNVCGFVLSGTTSESPTISFDEQCMLLKHTWKMALNKKFIVMGVGGNNTCEVVKKCIAIQNYCHAFMVTVPAYNKPPQRGIVDLFQQVSHACPNKPIMIYNIPGRTATDMLPETILTVLETCPNVMALKEASGNFENVEKMNKLILDSGVRSIGKDFKLFSGDDGNMIRLCKDHQGDGVISVASNVTPRNVSAVVKACSEKDYLTAEKIYSLYESLVGALFIDSNPIPLKYCLHKIGIFKSDAMRSPLMVIEDKGVMEKIDKALSECEETKFIVKIDERLL